MTKVNSIIHVRDGILFYLKASWQSKNLASFASYTADSLDLYIFRIYASSFR